MARRIVHCALWELLRQQKVRRPLLCAALVWPASIQDRLEQHLAVYAQEAHSAPRRVPDRQTFVWSAMQESTLIRAQALTWRVWTALLVTTPLPLELVFARVALGASTSGSLDSRLHRCAHYVVLVNFRSRVEAVFAIPVVQAHSPTHMV